MNKNFNRTKIGNGFLISDSDIKIETVFYPPHFESSDGLDIGNNDPDLKGAIATKIIDSVTQLFVYQGDDNWLQMQSGDEASPVLKLWQSGDSIKQNNYVTHVIGSIEYLFRSNEDGNTSEPSLSSGGGDAWDNLGPTQDGFSPDVWSNSTTYAIGDFSRIIASSKNVFKSKVNGNLNNQPLFNTTDTFWECLGDYKGLFPNDAPYALDDVSFDTATQSVYRSNVNSNNYALDAEISGSWALIGVAIKDSETSNSSTWSSSKILSEISAATIPDATATVKGKLKLAGDLGGTADSPTVPGLANRELLTNKATDFTTSNNTLYPSVQAVKNETDLKIPLTQKGIANGVTPLNSSIKIDALYLPDSLFGQLRFGGTYNGSIIDATSNFPELEGQPLPLPADYEGVFFIATANFTESGKNYVTGDWIVSLGTGWDKVANSDAVTTVFGRLGNIVANESDYSSFYPLLDGTGSTGTWPISVTGSAKYWGDGNEIVNDYTSVINGAMIGFGSDGKWHYANKIVTQTYLDINNGATLNNNISGNAATATDANKWNGSENDFSSIVSGTINGLMANDGTNVAKLKDATSVRTFLGIPSGGETLPSVMARGNTVVQQMVINPDIDILFGTPGGSSPGIGQYFNAASNNLKFYNAVGGADLFTLNEQTGNGAFGGTLVSQNAKIGNSSISGIYARFGHVSFDTSTNYGFMQDNTGQTFIGSTLLKVEGPAQVTGSVTASNFTGGLLESNANSGGTTSLKYVEDDGAWKLTSTFPGDATFDVAGSILATSATIGSTTIGTSTSNIQGTSTATYIRPTSGTGGGFVVFQNPSGTVDLGSVGINGWLGGAELTGTPTAPTATAGNNTTQIATTAFVQSAISSVTSGTYTPTVTGVSNVTGTPAPQLHHYTRIGNEVTVYGFCLINPTAGTNTSASISLPIATTTITTYSVIGHGSSTAPGTTVARISGSGGAAVINFNAVNFGSDHNFFYSFTYTVN